MRRGLGKPLAEDTGHLGSDSREGGKWVQETTGWGPDREVDRRNGELNAPWGPDLSFKNAKFWAVFS